MAERYKIYCPGCQALAINGVPCHEHGCRYSKQAWVTRGKIGYRHMLPEGAESPSWLKPEPKGTRESCRQ